MYDVFCERLYCMYVHNELDLFSTLVTTTALRREGGDLSLLVLEYIPV